MMLSLTTLKNMWDAFDTPIDDEERLEESFLGFPAGTPRMDVWHWFDDQFAKHNTSLGQIINEPSDDIVISFERGLFNDLEQAIIQRVAINFGRFMLQVSVNGPKRIAGESVDITPTTDNLNVSWYPPEQGGQIKKLHWQLVLLLDKYKP